MSIASLGVSSTSLNVSNTGEARNLLEELVGDAQRPATRDGERLEHVGDIGALEDELHLQLDGDGPR